MRGHIDRQTSKTISGWAFDPKSPDTCLAVQAILDGEVIATGIADKPRPDVGDAFGVPIWHGFALASPQLAAMTLPELERLEVQVRRSPEADWMTLPKPAAKNIGVAGRYQSFGEAKGDSDSQAKLAALHLDTLPGSQGRSSPLEGMAVLDLGCNEGFFCLEAVRQGARRVVGIDASAQYIEYARQRSSEVEFIHGSWWNIPQEKFDVILFLSALHYEEREKELLDKIATHLTPDGVLVLECGAVEDGSTSQAWRSIMRGDGPRRYATFQHLIGNVLSSYAVRHVHKSVDQRGDPIPRYVFHCTPRRSIALLVRGESKTGKTILTNTLASPRVAVYRIDELYNRLITNTFYQDYAVAKLLREKNVTTERLDVASKLVVDKKLEEEFAAIIAAEVPIESPAFCIEGHALQHKSISAALERKLAEMRVDCWDVSKKP